MTTSLFTSKAFNQPLDPEIFGAGNKELNISVKRLDLIDRIWGGNKLFKLRPNLAYAREQGYKGILTFGGAYSNHIAATSALTRSMDLESIGVIRGERPKKISVTLQRAEDQGMRLEFISREEYKKRNDPGYLAELQNTFPDHWIIPEGGTNKLGIEGCRGILDTADTEFNHILVAAGTGGTAAGIISSCSGSQFVTCVAVLNAGTSIGSLIGSSVNVKEPNWMVNEDYSFGGYAKRDPSLEQFIHDFNKVSGIQIEPVYTGKLFYGLRDMIMKKRFNRDDKILVIHSGGLQYLDY